jgi:hypothetical protein
VLTLPLHPHVAGAPQRLPHLAEAISILSERSDVKFVTGSELADWLIASEA